MLVYVNQVNSWITLPKITVNVNYNEARIACLTGLLIDSSSTNDAPERAGLRVFQPFDWLLSNNQDKVRLEELFLEELTQAFSDINVEYS